MPDLNYLQLIADNKDVLFTIVLVPMIWYFIRNLNSMNESLLKEIEKMNKNFSEHTSEDAKFFTSISLSLNNINNSIETHNKVSSEHFDSLRNNIGTIPLGKNEAIQMMKKTMLSWSYKKLDFLEKRLNKNDIVKRADIIKRQIKIELLRLSDEEYLNFLDWFILNWVKLGQYIRDSFKFDEFIEEVFDAFFDEKSDIPRKLKNILEVMKFHQSECIEVIKTKLNV